MQDIVRIKPHHFLDIITSFGGGQRTFEPHPYGHAVHTVAERILLGSVGDSDRTVTLKLVLGIDDICAPCKNNQDGVCVDTIDTSYRPEAPSSKEAWNERIDLRLFERLELKEGARLTASAFCRTARERLDDLSGIWREVPRDMTAERERKLMKGISFYLGEDTDNTSYVQCQPSPPKAGAAPSWRSPRSSCLY